MDALFLFLCIAAIGIWVLLPVLDSFTMTRPGDGQVIQYYTFPFGHELQDGYVIVHGISHKHCREIMQSIYGDEWEYAYDSLEQAEKMKIGKYELKLVAEIREGRSA